MSTVDLRRQRLHLVSEPTSNPPIRSGKISDSMIGPLKKGATSMPGTSLTIEQLLLLLADTPRRIAEISTGITPAQLRTSPNPDEWSANDVLAHLRSCADVWGGCIKTMVAEDTPTIKAINPRSWI